MIMVSGKDKKGKPVHYMGNGSSNIIHNLGFKPDMVIVKNKNGYWDTTYFDERKGSLSIDSLEKIMREDGFLSQEIAVLCEFVIREIDLSRNIRETFSENKEVIDIGISRLRTKGMIRLSMFGGMIRLSMFGKPRFYFTNKGKEYIEHLISIYVL